MSTFNINLSINIEAEDYADAHRELVKLISLLELNGPVVDVFVNEVEEIE